MIKVLTKKLTNKYESNVKKDLEDGDGISENIMELYKINYYSLKKISELPYYDEETILSHLKTIVLFGYFNSIKSNSTDIPYCTTKRIEDDLQKFIDKDVQFTSVVFHPLFVYFVIKNKISEFKNVTHDCSIYSDGNAKCPKSIIFTKGDKKYIINYSIVINYIKDDVIKHKLFMFYRRYQTYDDTTKNYYPNIVNITDEEYNNFINTVSDEHYNKYNNLNTKTYYSEDKFFNI